MRNALGGLAIAVAIAVVVSGARVWGIDAWKIVLALVGLVVFAWPGRGKAPSP